MRGKSSEFLQFPKGRLGKTLEMKFKIIHDQRHPKKDNTCPLKLRIYEGSGYKESSLNIFLLDGEWDADTQTVLKTCRGHKNYNSKLVQVKSDLEKKILFNIDPTPPAKPKAKYSIIDYGRKLSKEFELVGKTGNCIVYNTAVEMLLRYTNQKNILFEEIDYAFLNNFQNDLLKRDVGVNTISIYLRTIRAIFNKAINEELTENYPFKKFKIKQQTTPSRSLTLDEIKKIASYKCSGDRELNRDLFLLSYCLIGINFSDLLTLTTANLVDGRITFSRSKTHKVYSIFLHPQAASLIEKWHTKTYYLLPIMSKEYKGMVLKKKLQQAIHVCNNYMKKIAKDLEIQKDVSTYFARYSWANICRNLGYSKDLIAEALGHQYGNRVTGIYLDSYDTEMIDAANCAVIKAVFGG